MRRAGAILGSAFFLVIAPGTVAGLVPWWITGWRFQAPFLNAPWIRLLGILMIAAGLPALFDSFARFALQGRGTPAPVFPTRHLVVTGLYRHVRNPMYVSVVSLIAGQALLLGSRTLLAYGFLVWLAFHSFVLLYEEPVLLSTFGAEYEAYRRGVGRWVPRLRPWRGLLR